MSETTTKKRKASLPLLIAGGVSSLVLALGMSPTFSAFTASITNNANTANSGTLIMEESDAAASTICRSDAVSLANNNNASCAIDKYGPNTPMAPGGSFTTTVTIKNAGTIKANTFTMAPGTCTQTVTPSGAPNDACTKFSVKVYAAATVTGTAIYTGTAATFTSQTLAALNPGASQAYTFVVTFDSGASNSYQGITISQPIVWTFQS